MSPRLFSQYPLNLGLVQSHTSILVQLLFVAQIIRRGSAEGIVGLDPLHHLSYQVRTVTEGGFLGVLHCFEIPEKTRHVILGVNDRLKQTEGVRPVPGESDDDGILM